MGLPRVSPRPALVSEYVEKPLKLVLKVGGSEVTELSTGSSGHDSSLFEDRSDHDKHKDRKRKKRKKGEKQAPGEEKGRKRRRVKVKVALLLRAPSPAPYPVQWDTTASGKSGLMEEKPESPAAQQVLS